MVIPKPKHMVKDLNLKQGEEQKTDGIKRSLFFFFPLSLTWIYVTANKLENNISADFIRQGIQVLDDRLSQIFFVLLPHCYHSSHLEFHRLLYDGFHQVLADRRNGGLLHRLPQMEALPICVHPSRGKTELVLLAVKKQRS